MLDIKKQAIDIIIEGVKCAQFNNKEIAENILNQLLEMYALAPL